jgi:hypothetical protein
MLWLKTKQTYAHTEQLISTQAKISDQEQVLLEKNACF